MKLWVIGNGFDLHHGLHTKYTDYKGWLEGEHPDVLEGLSSIPYLSLSNSDDWCDLEKSLEISSNELKKLISCEIASTNDPNDIADTELNLESHLRLLARFKGEYFAAWLRNIDFSAAKPILSFGASDFYLTFNYSTLLEDTYKIPGSSIYHVHGVLDDETMPILKADLPLSNILTQEDIETTEFLIADLINADIIGERIIFGNPDNSIDALRPVIGGSQADVTSDVFKYVDEIIELLNKDVCRRKELLREKLPLSVDEVCILGVSSPLGVDKSYFEDVLAKQYQNVKWVKYCMDLNCDAQKADFREFCRRYRLNADYRSWDSLHLKSNN